MREEARSENLPTNRRSPSLSAQATAGRMSSDVLNWLLKVRTKELLGTKTRT